MYTTDLVLYTYIIPSWIYLFKTSIFIQPRKFKFASRSGGGGGGGESDIDRVIVFGVNIWEYMF